MYYSYTRIKESVTLICHCQVAKENKTTPPSAGLFIIRYHSFYDK